MSDLRIPVFHCPFCGKVKKHGEWIRLTLDEMVNLYRSNKVVVIGLHCPKCKELKHA